MAKARASRENHEIRNFILRNVADNPGTIGALTADRFGVSRTTVSGYMKRLVAVGLLTATGSTKARRYTARPIARAAEKVSIDASLQEDKIWRDSMLSAVSGVDKKIIDICQYGFTEMLNNVIDHSGSRKATLAVMRYYHAIDIVVQDVGVGIFNKIRRDFHLSDARTALLELSKGKLTSDKKNHTGEGIFFTSRMFSRFAISSGNLHYMRNMQRDDEWLIDILELEKFVKGTFISMNISTEASWSIDEIFAKYQDENYSFAKTHIPIALGRYGEEQLVSRSQAKRILARSELFKEILLDFQGIQSIGQAFADEMFRVFPANHPDLHIAAINAPTKITKIIQRLSSDASNVVCAVQGSIVVVKGRSVTR